jgi:hypothetical protein
MDPKYNNLILLVHPLYDLFHTSSISSKIDKDSLSSHVQKLLTTKEHRQQLKKSFLMYGKFLTENVTKDSIVLFLKPPVVDSHIYLSLKNPEAFYNLRIIENKYNDNFEKFISFFQKKFPDRFFVYDKELLKFSSNGYVFAKDILPKSVLKQLNKEITIRSIGEYLFKSKIEFLSNVPRYRGCVNLYSNQLKLFLEKKRIASKIIFMKKFILPFEKQGAFRKVLLNPTEKRRLQNKEKKKKLNLRKKLK